MSTPFIVILLLSIHLISSINFHNKWNILKYFKATKSSYNKQNEIDINKINQFIKLRAANNENRLSRYSYWHHSGVLRNPYTGKEIVGIEGIEIIYPIDYINTKNHKKNTINNTTTAATNDIYKKSYLSKKIFFYVDKDNHNQVIEKFRLQIQSPLRNIKPIKILYELVTLGIDNNNKLFASVEYPSGRTIRTSKIQINNQINTISILERILLCKEKLQIINYMSGMPKKMINRWISFNHNKDIGNRGKSQEYYIISKYGGIMNLDIENIIPKLSLNILYFYINIKDSLNHIISRNNNKYNNNINNNNNNTSLSSIHKQNINWILKNKLLLNNINIKPQITMSYQRYGESPSWFSINHACSIEIKSNKYTSSKYIPINIKEFIERNQPEFINNNYDISTITQFRKQIDLLNKYLPWYSYYNIFNHK